MERRGKARKQGVNFHRREQTASVVAHRIFIGNMDKRVTEYQVVQLCRPFGSIVQEQFCWTTAGPHKGTPAGYCFVEFSSRREAEAAVRGLNGKVVGGRALRVAFAREQESETAAVQESSAAKTDAITVRKDSCEASGRSEGVGSEENGSGVVYEDAVGAKGGTQVAKKESEEAKGARPSASTTAVSKATPRDIAGMHAKMEAIRAKLREMQHTKGVPQEAARPLQLPRPSAAAKGSAQARQHSRYRPY